MANVKEKLKNVSNFFKLYVYSSQIFKITFLIYKMLFRRSETLYKQNNEKKK